MQTTGKARDAFVFMLKVAVAGWEAWSVQWNLDSDKANELEVLAAKVRRFLKDEFGEDI